MIRVNILNSCEARPNTEEMPASTNRQLGKIPPGGDTIPTRGKYSATTFRSSELVVLKKSSVIKVETTQSYAFHF